MRKFLVISLVFLLAACGGTGPAVSGDGRSVTVYSADGLGTWYEKRFADFTAETGIAVNYVEAGSAEVVSRVQKEQSNPQADVLVTLPPFIQQAETDGLLQPSGVDTAGIDGATDLYAPVVHNYLSFIVNTQVADPPPRTFTDLLDPRFAGKIQYSTPGQAGDGTAVLLLLQQLYGKQGALDYLARLQPMTVGPSSSTGKLQPKVSKGEIAVANGDVQMNSTSIRDDASAFQIFFPATDDGVRSTLALPYVTGLAAGAPNADAGRALITYLLSEPVQQTVGADALGFAVRAGVPATPELARAIDGVRIIRPDWNAVLRDLDADLAAYRTATGQ